METIPKITLSMRHGTLNLSATYVGVDDVEEVVAVMQQAINGLGEFAKEDKCCCKKGGALGACSPTGV